MHIDPLSYCWTFIQRAIESTRTTIGRNANAMGLSLYRYDSTGRIVHYGPEGEVLENESAFQIIGVGQNHTGAPLSAQRQAGGPARTAGGH